MGLNVYLSHFEDAERYDKVYDEYTDKLALLRSELQDADGNILAKSSDVYNLRKSSLMAELNVDEYGFEIGNETEVLIDSTKYPSHLFKIGYFFSGHGDMALDRVLHRILDSGHDLRYIFEPEDEDDFFVPNWLKSLDRAQEVLYEYQVADKDNLELPNLYPKSILDFPSKNSEYDSNWYEQALEIVVETCEWALAQPENERSKYRLVWNS